MKDGLKERLLIMLDAIASESRWAGKHNATGDLQYERDSLKESNRLVVEVVKFIEANFTENE